MTYVIIGDFRFDSCNRFIAAIGTSAGRVGLWLIPLLLVGSVATAADRDVRLVQAAAEQDRAAVRLFVVDSIL